MPDDTANEPTFANYLAERGHLPHTRRAYLGVVSRAPNGDVAAYVRRLIRDRKPQGTVTQARAAAVHYLRFRGVPEAEIQAQLPPGRGRKPRNRLALTPEALDRYYAKVAELRDPVKSVLLLLPRTGLRISEMCGLQLRHVMARGETSFLAFRGKGDKERFVPLGPVGSTLVQAAVARAQRRAPGDDPEGRPLFVARGTRALSPSTVRAALVKLRKDEPLLKDVAPHSLRHTYATRALASGVTPLTLQTLLGHESLQTTQLYVHPTVDDLAASLDNMDGL